MTGSDGEHVALHNICLVNLCEKNFTIILLYFTCGIVVPIPSCMFHHETDEILKQAFNLKISF